MQAPGHAPLPAGSRQACQPICIGLPVKLGHAILVSDASGVVVHRSAPASCDRSRVSGWGGESIGQSPQIADADAPYSRSVALPIAPVGAYRTRIGMPWKPMSTRSEL